MYSESTKIYDTIYNILWSLLDGMVDRYILVDMT